MPLSAALAGSAEGSTQPTQRWDQVTVQELLRNAYQVRESD